MADVVTLHEGWSVEVTARGLNKQWQDSVCGLTCAFNHRVVWTELDSDVLNLV